MGCLEDGQKQTGEQGPEPPFSSPKSDDELKLDPETPLLDSDMDLDEWPEHQDERQIKLDTDRSFVIYPVGETTLLRLG